MNLSFAGLDHSICFDATHVTVVQVANEMLFARLCQSLLSGKGEEALESYSIWDEQGNEVKPSGAFIPILNPFDLPWGHKSLMGALPLQIESIMLQDEDQRARLQSLSSELERTIVGMGLQLNADYSFRVEWMLKNHLKAFGFNIDVPEGASLLDNLMMLVELAADTHVNETFLFVNLKTFLSRNELKQLFRTLIFHGIRAIMLENREVGIYSEFEQKTVVDRDFIEYQVSGWSDDPSLSQGRICSNGFGAVTF